MKHKARFFPNELSGGEQQRVSIARSIVNNPAVMIADEPTGNLDPDTSWEIMHLFEEINDRGTTIVMATHNKEIVNTLKSVSSQSRMVGLCVTKQEGSMVFMTNSLTRHIRES